MKLHLIFIQYLLKLPDEPFRSFSFSFLTLVLLCPTMGDEIVDTLTSVTYKSKYDLRNIPKLYLFVSLLINYSIEIIVIFHYLLCYKWRI